MATAMVSFIGSLGEAFGVGIGGVVFQNEWNRHVHEQMSAGNIPAEYYVSYRQAEHVASLIQGFPGPVQTLYRVIMAGVINSLFIVLAALSGAALLVSLGSRNLSLSRETKSIQQFKEKVKVESPEM